MFKLSNKLVNNTCLECKGCELSQNNGCKCFKCLEGYYLDDNYICKNCKEPCLNYEENTCKCLDKFSFYGYYKNINESMNILNTNNLTNVEDEILESIRNKLEIGEINSLYIDNGFSFLVYSPKAKFIISNFENKDDTIIEINLGECENRIRSNQSPNNSLYMLYAEVNEDYMNIPRTEYEIYSNSNNKFENVNLEVCKDIKINKSVSINISNSDIDRYNSSSGYYNDICYTYTTENYTDITIIDRRNEYINNNMSICENDCQFIFYDSNERKATCSCPISLNITHISDNQIDIELLKSNFINFKNIANIEMLKCYYLLFNNNIFKNIGCVVISLIIFIDLICLLLYYFHDNKKLKIKIKNILESKSFENKESFKENNLFNEKNNKQKNSHEVNKNNEIIDNKNRAYSPKKRIIHKKSKSPKRKSKNSPKRQIKSSNSFPPKKDIESNNSRNVKNIPMNNPINKNDNNNFIYSFEPLAFNNVNEDKKGIYKEVMQYNDIELNLLPYKQAIISDKRNYIQYCFSLVKTRHLFIFSFFYNKDYNSRVIKINLFFFTFAVNYTVNALFFNDETMHKIYIDGGTFDFIYQIPQILYSTIISSVLIIIVKTLALSEKNVLKIKNAKKEELIKIFKSETKCINCKFIVYFIISFILLIIFWYYVGCFCAVYKNTQMHLINDTLISFGTSLIYPFCLYLIPGIFRIPSLQNKEKDGEYMYKVSLILQLFV